MVLPFASGRPATRDVAVGAMARLHSPDFLPHLLRMVQDPRVSSKVMIEALAAYPLQEVVPRIIPYLRDMALRPRVHGILTKLTRVEIAPQAHAWEEWWKRKSSG